MASPAMHEIRKRNNIWYLEKWEIFFSFAYQSAVWLLFRQNPIEIIVDNIPSHSPFITQCNWNLRFMTFQFLKCCHLKCSAFFQSNVMVPLFKTKKYSSTAIKISKISFHFFIRHILLDCNFWYFDIMTQTCCATSVPWIAFRTENLVV